MTCVESLGLNACPWHNGLELSLGFVDNVIWDGEQEWRCSWSIIFDILCMDFLTCVLCFGIWNVCVIIAKKVAQANLVLL